MRTGILTLTTDFGSDGPYVAAVKGVVLGLAPGTQLVDVSHTISPQNILEGAFVLAGIIEAFPPGTVHLAVIDPGVGTDRRLIAVAVADQWFVLPDNGLITGVARGRTPTGIWELTNPSLRRPTVAPTFHGRDILAPAAAHLVRGGDPAELGPVRTRFQTLLNFEPIASEGGFVGEVLFRDTFGNLVTNLSAERIASLPLDSWTIDLAGSRIDGLVRTYGERPTGSLVALVGSTGWIEIAVVNGDAASQLMVGPGTTVWLRKK
ncbi:MAG TPA: SAM-dependent chlorinase/fluorinase [Isosphaeraceae bacterium]|nr:SAM-dependent chlorinase/fluorinase [Isosphaeraceae bacterium]